jgi:hypothetical protein
LASALPPAGIPSASTHSGVIRRSTKFGTACAKISCLSAMEIELSIMNSRSILSTAV